MCFEELSGLVGRVQDLGSKGCEFETNLRHYVVCLYPLLNLFNPGRQESVSTGLKNC